MSSVYRPVRVDAELSEWFDNQFPWRGSFPQFVNEALAAFRQEWGDREPPHEVLERAMARLAPKYREG